MRTPAAPVAEAVEVVVEVVVFEVEVEGEEVVDVVVLEVEVVFGGAAVGPPQAATTRAAALTAPIAAALHSHCRRPRLT